MGWAEKLEGVRSDSALHLLAALRAARWTADRNGVRRVRGFGDYSAWTRSAGVCSMRQARSATSGG